eukprot:8063636-Pyramimonas_sp.AAC.1
MSRRVGAAQQATRRFDVALSMCVAAARGQEVDHFASRIGCGCVRALAAWLSRSMARKEIALASRALSFCQITCATF